MITLITSPDDYRPAYNPIEWVFSSDNTTQCDFSYICDVYINGSFAVRLRTFSEGPNDYGYLRIDRIIQDYLSFNFRPDQTGFIGNDKGICSYYLEVREQYNSNSDCTGITTLSSVLYTSSTNYAWNGALQYKEYTLFTQQKYVAMDGNSKFLTNLPNKSLIPLSEKFTLGFLQSAAAYVHDAQIKTYDQTGALINTYLYPNAKYAPANQYELKITFGAGPANLNIAALGGSPSPTQPIIDFNVSYYTLQLLNISGDPLSETKRFDIDNRCSPYSNNRIWWLNRLGEFDSYQFNLISSKSLSIIRNEFNKLLNTNYSEGDRGQSVMSVQGDYSLTFNSNWLTENEGKWLEELFTSPEVYVMDTESDTETYEITGADYNAGRADLVLDDSLSGILPIGSMFSYSVVNGSVIGMANSGTGMITGYSGSGRYQTNIVATINAGAIITGSMIADLITINKIPLVLTSSSYDEKKKINIKNIQYTIIAKPTFKTNSQSL